MSKGRKTKPNELKELQGTLRPHRVKTDAIKPTIELSTTPPEELNEWGSQLYEVIMSEYCQIGLITRVDTGSLLMLCNEFGTYCEADDLIKAQGLEIEEEKYNKDGNVVGYVKTPNPNLKTRNDALKNYKALCVEFGLTPSSRAALNAPKPKEKDELSELL